MSFVPIVFNRNDGGGAERRSGTGFPLEHHLTPPISTSEEFPRWNNLLFKIVKQDFELTFFPIA